MRHLTLQLCLCIWHIWPDIYARVKFRENIPSVIRAMQITNATCTASFHAPDIPLTRYVCEMS